MLYKLLIVDDEKIIREGLNQFVDWEMLGFEVVACLVDGKDAIRYMEDHPVDVVLTDIKMTFVSGLELACHIYKNKPAIKVVIISGYKDFEYAKQAISYNVVHYILKPTQMDELNQVFHEIKNQLDREREEKESLTRERKQYYELIPILKEQFFTDLLMGALRSRGEIEKRLKLLNLEKDFDQKRCHVLKIRLHDFDRFLEGSWKHGKEGFHNAIRNMFHEEDSNMDYFTVNCNYGSILVLAVEQVRTDDALLKDILRSRFENIRITVEKIFGLKMDIAVQHSFDNIYDLAQNGLQDVLWQEAAEKNVISTPNSRDLTSLFNKQKLLVSNMTAGNTDAVVNLFDTIMNDLKDVDIPTVQNFLLELFSLLSSKLKDIDIDIYTAADGRLNYNHILTINDISRLKEWGNHIMNIITAYVGKRREISENKVIEKVKEYISNHYNKDISLDDAADHVYLSTVYLSRFFKQCTGENFIDYLIKVRMEKAMDFLRNPRYKVYEIGQMVGYKSIRYFSATFKKYTGMTPSEYRRNYLEEGEALDEK